MFVDNYHGNFKENNGYLRNWVTRTTLMIPLCSSKRTLESWLKFSVNFSEPYFDEIYNRHVYSFGIRSGCSTCCNTFGIVNIRKTVEALCWKMHKESSGKIENLVRRSETWSQFVVSWRIHNSFPKKCPTTRTKEHFWFFVISFQLLFGCYGRQHCKDPW